MRSGITTGFNCTCEFRGGFLRNKWFDRDGMLYVDVGLDVGEVQKSIVLGVLLRGFADFA